MATLGSITPSCVPLTTHDLLAIGQRFGIDYRFPEAPDRSQPAPCVARGRVMDVEIDPTLRVTHSDLDVLHAYASTSRRAAPWFLSVILEGHIQVGLGQQSFQLQAGGAFSAHFNEQTGLEVFQPAPQHLRILNLSILADSGSLSFSSTNVAPPSTPVLHTWQVPPLLRHSLEAALASNWPAERQRLLWQGLALQLLAHGLPDAYLEPRETEQAVGQSQGLSHRDHQRLERLRKQLEEHPYQVYRLEQMARNAAMSPSSLRSKFQRCYGCSIFDYLRRCRLTQAQDYLRKGYSVQQTAHACGYRHATNFATAFKRAFGIAPHEVHHRH
ncbi:MULTISPECIES: helix-turn-helix transcriptional regulator [unclassified Halomonas]|uniref:helix-turn-helix transcriptional regulator n=1 Tax=unclassified Halomonas TaxID=2609666 RepID=UPI001CF21256|nr:MULTISPECIES: helix-turn-helix transcriptional regulator [unclassified Halomonas]MCA8866316.1 helix-turn-helix transcriptional regulator [Halomonas sp. SBBP1]UZH09883.1 helix-turn-helix transcriptional regulator [Halomonas sp. BDJS001]